LKIGLNLNFYRNNPKILSLSYTMRKPIPNTTVKSRHKKQEIIDWLTERKIEFPDNALKIELLNLVKKIRKYLYS
jgi:hypothetical protein